jgi:hypothetical protein
MLELDEALEQRLEENAMARIGAQILTSSLQGGGYIRPEGIRSSKEARTVSSTRYSVWISVVDIVSPMIVRGRQVESGEGVNKPHRYKPDPSTELFDSKKCSGAYDKSHRTRSRSVCVCVHHNATANDHYPAL